jgi:hypothetical protein
LEAISVFHWLRLSERYQGCEPMAASDMAIPPYMFRPCTVTVGKVSLRAKRSNLASPASLPWWQRLLRRASRSSQ